MPSDQKKKRDQKKKDAARKKGQPNTTKKVEDSELDNNVAPTNGITKPANGYKKGWGHLFIIINYVYLFCT